jgi:hypothetical protein
MDTKHDVNQSEDAIGKIEAKALPRRSFLRYAGTGATLVTLTLTGIAGISGCSKDNSPNPGNEGVDLGSDDIGILNYAYALEQLEAAFYTQVIKSPFSSITDGEMALLTDIRDHEIAHREFFKTALAAKAIAGLEVDFSKIDFSSRDSVLGTAKAFEDLGVSAYNGAGSLLKTPNYLVLAGKIVSVEARHAAYLRDLVTPGSFAGDDVVNNMGLETSRTPPQVLQIAGAYVKTKIDASHLPTS